MTVATGTASSYDDLLDRFLTFITGLSGGQDWDVLDDTVEAGVERIVYLRAPGLAGADQIYTSIHQLKNVGDDVYNLAARGYTGHLSLSTRTLQPGATPQSVALCLWDDSIPYTFIANGRCAKIIAKVSTVFEQMYLGFIVPHASPSEYQYPLFIGGMHYDEDERFSDSTERHTAFWDPSNNSSALGSYQSQALLRTPGAQWWAFQNKQQSGGSNTSGSLIFPTAGYNTSMAARIGKLFDSSAGYGLPPFVLHSSHAPATFGELDGVYSISGNANSSESIQTIDGDDYLVVQNAHRTANENYAAYKLV